MSNFLFSIATIAASISLNGRVCVPRLDPTDNSNIESYIVDLELDNHSYDYLYNLEGDLRYVLVSDQSQYFIYDLENDNLVRREETPSPFANEIEISMHIYTESKSSIPFLCTDGRELWEPYNPDYRVPLDFLNNQRVFGEYPSSNEMSGLEDQTTHKANNYKYFVNLRGRHGLNNCNCCGTIAIQILLGYYDSFLSDSYISEIYDLTAIDNLSSVGNWENWSRSPSSGFKGGDDNNNSPDYQMPIDNRFRNYLNDIAINNYAPNLYTDGLSFNQERNILTYYLDEKNIAHSYNTSEGNLVDIYSQRSKTIIKNAIDAGRPLIAGTIDHFVVPFAYNDDYVYAHNGWGWCGKVEWHVFTDFIIGQGVPCAIDLVPTVTTHSCNNNYYSTVTNTYYCSCGSSENTLNTTTYQLGIPTSPSSTEITQVYSDNYNATFKHKNVYKYTNSTQVHFNNNSYIEIEFVNNVRGICIYGKNSATSNTSPNIVVQTKQLLLWLTYFDLSAYTRLNCNNTDKYVCISFSNNYTRKIKIKVDNANGYTNLFTMYSLRVDFC